MADNGPNPDASQLPPPPQQGAGAPGYDPAQGGQGNPAHLPPPPLHIPQNNNPIPTAITSPMSGAGKVMSPGGGPGFGRRSAPEPNKRALYVGGLDQRVTEEVLRQIFETTGHVQSVKIIPDKNVGFSLPSAVWLSYHARSFALLSAHQTCASGHRTISTLDFSARLLTFLEGKGLQLWLRGVRRPRLG